MGFYYFKARVFNEIANKMVIEQGFVVGTSLPDAFNYFSTKYYDEKMIDRVLEFSPVSEDETRVVLLPKNAEISVPELDKMNFGYSAD